MRVLLVWLVLFFSATAMADEVAYKPYVLAAEKAGSSVEKVVAETRKQLLAAGYEVVGSYAPFADAQVIAISNSRLRAFAAPSLSAFAAVVHVGITRVGDRVQVSCLNPNYLAAAYRVAGGLDSVATDLARVLGNVEAFGADKGRTRQQLLRYRYLPGMENFEDVYALARHASQAEALKVVEQNLAAHVGGAAKVYRLDLPGDRTIFGVSRADSPDERVNEHHVLAEVVDAGVARKTTPYLPYQILVESGRVSALHMRFRMAVWHPDLTMLTFGKLMSSPGALETFLARVAGATP